MPQVDPLQTVIDAGARIRDNVVPQIEDRFVPKTRRGRKGGPRFSLDRLNQDDYEGFLAREVERYGEGEVMRHLRQQMTREARRRGLL